MSNEPKAGPGLDPELLAAYVDQRLSPEQRAAVEAQLAADPDSHAVLVETMKAIDALKVPESVRSVRKPRKVPGMAIAGGLLAAAAALVLIVQVQPEWWVRLRGGDPRFDQLVAAVGERRFIEPRLTGGFRFGPVRSVTRGQVDVSGDTLQLLAASADFQDQANTKPSAVNLHVAGVAKLLTGSLDEAVQLLQRAQTIDREGVAIWIDLSAAYLARGTATGSNADLRNALDLAQRAADADPDSSEALFNRALAAERLGASEAIGYWQAAADQTADSQWRSEALRNLERLRESLR